MSLNQYVSLAGGGYWAYEYTQESLDPRLRGGNGMGDEQLRAEMTLSPDLRPVPILGIVPMVGAAMNKYLKFYVIIGYFCFFNAEVVAKTPEQGRIYSNVKYFDETGDVVGGRSR